MRHQGLKPTEAMAKPFTISVVIPLYNKEQAIECTVKSVLRQSRPADELIIVDDGSTDASVAKVERLLKAEKPATRVRILRQRNEGVSVARNRGAEEARHEFIAFLDGDDEWEPDCIAEFERLAAQCPEAPVLTVLLAKVGPGGTVVPERTVLPDGFFGEVPNPLDAYRRGYGIMSSSSVAVRKDAWRRSGGFMAGVQNGEDICWWVKLMMTERLAHSGRVVSIWHDEFSGAADRVGAVPYHFSYFLGSSEGRSYLRDPALVKFLASNLPVQIGGRRLAGDQEVVAELRRLSKALPLRLKGVSLASSIAPKWLLRAAMSVRRARMRRALPGTGVSALGMHPVRQSKL